MQKSPKSIAVVAGEASGDLHGAYLVRSVRRLLPDADVWGVGGTRMREMGVRLVYDSSLWSAIGIFEALKLAPRMLLILFKIEALLKKNPPDLLVLIDFGAFNIPLGRFARKMGIRTLYYVTPGSWNRHGNFRRLVDTADRAVTPFPWAAELLGECGMRADFFGHPLLDVVKPKLSREEFCKYVGFDADKHIVGLLPGSRSREVHHCLPAMLEAARMLHAEIPDLQFAVPLSPSVKIGEADQDAADHVKFIRGMAWDVLAHSRAAVVVSGTATLEAAILDCPMTIIYKGSRMSQFEYALRGKPLKYIGLPNIILDEMVCRELIQDNASPDNIFGEMNSLIGDTPKRAKMVGDLMRVKGMLGGSGAVDRTAEVALEMLAGTSV